MFDDPREDLVRLQRELLAADEEPRENDEDPEEALDEMKELLRREDWEEQNREPLYRSYSRDYEEEPAEYQPEQEPPAPKKKSSTGIIVTAILEAIALLAFLGWWVVWKM